MKIGFLTDKNGYRAPIHPESIEKYSLDVHLEKDIFEYLKYSESIQNHRIASSPHISSKLLDIFLP